MSFTDVDLCFKRSIFGHTPQDQSTENTHCLGGDVPKLVGSSMIVLVIYFCIQNSVIPSLNKFYSLPAVVTPLFVTLPPSPCRHPQSQLPNQSAHATATSALGGDLCCSAHIQRPVVIFWRKCVFFYTGVSTLNCVSKESAPKVYLQLHLGPMIRCQTTW